MGKTRLISILIHIILMHVYSECRRPNVFSASLPGRCPSPPCECTADELNRKRVTCFAGNLSDIPVDKMDKEIQVLNITAPKHNLNHISLGRIFIELDRLEEVHITYSNLPAIGDSSFWPGRALKLLNLSHNSITFVSETDFKHLDNLLVLDLSDNFLSGAVSSAVFRHLTNLTSLSLAGNQFRKLVTRLFMDLKRLTKLDLSRNPLSVIDPDDFRDIKHLSILNLSKCRLKRLQPLVAQSFHWFEVVPNLTYLDLSDNQLEYLTSYEFSSLQKLRQLRLNGNMLSVLMDFPFSGLLVLDYLDLSSNQISSMSSCTFCNSSISRLDISNNKFTSFQSKILEPLSDSLTTLVANTNRDLIDSTSSVAYLVQPLKKLNHLSLTYNSLDDTMIESSFYNLESLVSLNLSHNRFANISGRLLTPLINLQVLDLSNNQIHGLVYSVFTQINSLTKLKAIYLNDNPWSCYRCHIMPAMDWMDTSPTAYFNVCHRYSKEHSRLKSCIKCMTPGQLSGKYLHLMNEFDLEWCSDPRVTLRLTASEPQIGLILAIFIILSLIFVIIAVIVFYRKQGAVYYTHEDDLYEEKTIVAPVFSVASTANTSVKHPVHCPVQSSPYSQYAQPPPSPHPSPHSSPTMASTLPSKAESLPRAGPSLPLSPPSVQLQTVPTVLTTPPAPQTTTTTTTMRIIRPKVQIYI